MPALALPFVAKQAPTVQRPDVCSWATAQARPRRPWFASSSRSMRAAGGAPLAEAGVRRWSETRLSPKAGLAGQARDPCTCVGTPRPECSSPNPMVPRDRTSPPARRRWPRSSSLEAGGACRSWVNLGAPPRRCLCSGAARRSGQLRCPAEAGVCRGVEPTASPRRERARCASLILLAALETELSIASGRVIDATRFSRALRDLGQRQRQRQRSYG